jgi:phosphoribosylformylglycinamidine cyclo-ligase
MKKKAYARAGVDIDLGNRVKSTLPALLASTHRKEVLGKVGGFGGLFALDTKNYREPVLVSSVDGVGTKLKVAFAMGRHSTIGADLVNHCVNDIAVLGAEPLFFLDYIGTGKLQPKVFSQIIEGFVRACRENGCALVGGETAQMPGFYQKGEYDLSGTIVGVVEKSKMISGKNIRSGDAIIGLASSGLHTNGYSLARKILLDDLKLKLFSKLPGSKKSVGEELLKVHVSYGKVIQSLLKKFPNQIHGMAHITGGGFIDNLPRVLPDNCDAVIRKNSWETLPIFEVLQKRGKVEARELYQVFNMGIGMVLAVPDKKAETILKAVRQLGHRSWVIGEIVPGKRQVQLRP